MAYQSGQIVARTASCIRRDDAESNEKHENDQEDEQPREISGFTHARSNGVLDDSRLLWRPSRPCLRHCPIIAWQYRALDDLAQRRVVGGSVELHDVDENTRESNESLIRVHIRPALGDLPLTTLVRKATETVEQFYGELRRCRQRCDGRTLIDHRADGEHDCGEAGCRPHICRPLAAATVCRIHAVLSAACRAALRWGWIPLNPMDAVRQPSKPKPSPQPPTPAETARLVEEATRQDPEWGLYLWLAVVTGARRGEMCALRWSHLDLDAGVMTVRRNYVWGARRTRRAIRCAGCRSTPPRSSCSVSTWPSAGSGSR